MKQLNLSQVYQNLMITAMFAFLFFNATPAQRNEMIKITMNALDSANQTIIKVQTTNNPNTVVDTFETHADSVRKDSVK
jgi:hypothetical protein